MGISYIDPDTFYCDPRAMTFMYTYNHNFYWASGFDTHFEMIKNQPKLAEELNFKPEVMDDIKLKIRFLNRCENSYALFGRAIDRSDKTIISFWNEKPKFVLELIEPCVQAVLPKLHAMTGFEPKEDVLVCTPFKTNWWSKWRSGHENPTSQDVQLLRNLHLMKPQEKKKAMEKLGLQTKGKGSPWMAAMSQAGLMSPGQKIWAPQSETFKEWLNLQETELHKCQDCDRMIAGAHPRCLFCQSKKRKEGICTWCGEEPLVRSGSKYCEKCQAEAIRKAHSKQPMQMPSYPKARPSGSREAIWQTKFGG